MRFLVTGATGCVGRAVVATARAAGHEVTGLARRHVELGVPLVMASVEDAAAVARAAAGHEVVVHLASWVHRVPEGPREEAELRRSILDGTRHVAEAARDAGARLVVASTVAVGQATPYGRAKLEAEELARAACPGALILRIALVYGPHDRGNMAVLARAIARRRALIVGPGTNRKSMVFVDNLADRIVLGAEGGIEGTFVAADGPATQAEIMNGLARALGRRPPPRVPLAPARLLARLAGRRWAERIDKLASDSIHDGAPLDARLGYRPRVSFEEGLRREVAWLRAEGHV